MAAGDGEYARNALGERIKLMASKVDAKIFFHMDAVVEYMDMKNMIGDIAEEKEKVEQERRSAVVLTRREILAPVEVELMAAKEELAAVREQLAQRNDVDEKDEELADLRLRLQKMEARNRQTESDPVQLQPTRGKSF